MTQRYKFLTRDCLQVDSFIFLYQNRSSSHSRFYSEQFFSFYDPVKDTDAYIYILHGACKMLMTVYSIFDKFYLKVLKKLCVIFVIILSYLHCELTSS